MARPNGAGRLNGMAALAAALCVVSAAAVAVLAAGSGAEAAPRRVLIIAEVDGPSGDGGDGSGGGAGDPGGGGAAGDVAAGDGTDVTSTSEPDTAPPTTESTTSSSSSTTTSTTTTSTTTTTTTTSTTLAPTTTVPPTVVGGPPQFVDDPSDRFTPVFGLRVTPGITLAGTTMTGVGRGFEPGELVTGMQYSTPVALGWQRADDDGVVTFTWVLRGDEPLGRHEVRLTGERSGSLSAWFEVTDVLPNSGADTAVLVAVALALLAGGVVLAAAARRSAR